MWFFGFLDKKGKGISTPKKIGYGMGIAALAYVFLMIFSLALPTKNELSTMTPEAIDTMRLTPWVMVGLYFILTVAELFISPLGISFVSKCSVIDELSMKKIATVPVEGLKMNRSFYIVRHKKRTLPPLVKEFHQFLLAQR